MDTVKRYANKNLALLIMRLALGIIFIAHGWMKFSNMEGTISFFASLGLASFFAYLVTAVELLGGIAVVLGIFTRISGVLIACVMLYAILFVKWSNGLTGAAGSYELDLALLALALGLACTGAGKYSLKGLMKKDCGNCNGGTCSC